MVVSGAYPYFFEREMGLMFQRGIEAQAAGHGLEMVYSGPPAMPFMTFKHDVKFGHSRAFAAACAEGGVYGAPYHNWFLSAAHQEKNIRRVLEVMDEAFAGLRRGAM